MAKKWFVRSAGKVSGPFTSDQLKSFASAGQISVSTELANELSGPWHLAGRIRDLFPSGAAPPSAALAAASPPLPRRAASPPRLQTPQSPSIPALPPSSIEPSLAASPEHLLISSPPSAAMLLLILVIGGYVVSGIAWAGFPENGLAPQQWTLTEALGFVAYFISLLVLWCSETILLFILWNALPNNRRPFQLHPALIVGIMFVPLVAYGWNFVALGFLGQAWLSVAQQEKTYTEASEAKYLAWLGFVLAALVALTWMLGWISEFGQLAWWTDPLLGEAAPNERFGNRRGGASDFFRWFSLKSIACFIVSWISFAFYGGVLNVWEKLSGKGPAESSGDA